MPRARYGAGFSDRLLGELSRHDDIHSVLDVHRVLNRGLAGAAIARFAERFGLANEDLCDLLGVALRTLQRRQKQQHLSPGETDRLWRAPVVLEEATDLLGSRAKASHWLRRPLRALGGTRPLDMLSTDVGYSEVRNVLGRLEWGVWS